MITVVDMLAAGKEDTPVDRAFKRLAPGKFLKQAIAAYMSIPDMYPDEMATARKMLTEAQAAVKQALAQGDPTNVKVQEHHAKHTKPVSLFIPGSATGKRDPLAGVHYKVEPGDPRNIMLGQETVSVVPDMTMTVGKTPNPADFAGIRRRS
jgi:hypothetical protein